MLWLRIYPYRYYGSGAFRDVDAHWKDAQFATAGSAVELWDYDRSEPITTLEWGADSVLSVRYNPAEPDLLASCGSDRGLVLYDARTSSPLHKVKTLNPKP